MARRLTTVQRGGLPFIDPTSGDIAVDIVSVATARLYLYDISGIKILINRSIEVCKSLGLNNALEIEDLTRNTPATNANDLSDDLDSANRAVNDNVPSLAGNLEARQEIMARTGWAIQGRIFRMMRLVSDLAVPFWSNYKALIAQGFTVSQSVRRATEEFLQGLQNQLDILDISNPDAFSRGAIEAKVQSREAVNEIMEHLSFSRKLV